MFFQAASVTYLFPVGFTVLSLLFPLQLRGVAVSLVMLVAFSLGGGFLPSAIGHWKVRWPGGPDGPLGIMRR